MADKNIPINPNNMQPPYSYSVVIDGKTRWIKVHPGGHISIKTSM